MHAEATDEVAVALVTITHDDLDTPIRLSSDPTERISLDPLAYGTRTRTDVFYFVLMSVIIPDESRGTPARSQLVLENVTSDMVALVRSIVSPAKCRIDIVAASNPDMIERTYDDLEITKASYDADRVTLEVGLENFANEPWPSQRMTKSRFPGLHK